MATQLIAKFTIGKPIVANQSTQSIKPELLKEMQRIVNQKNTIQRFPVNNKEFLIMKLNSTQCWYLQPINLYSANSSNRIIFSNQPEGNPTITGQSVTPTEFDAILAYLKTH